MNGKFQTGWKEHNARFERERSYRFNVA